MQLTLYTVWQGSTQRDWVLYDIKKDGEDKVKVLTLQKRKKAA
jgi:hypothetical protein